MKLKLIFRILPFIIILGAVLAMPYYLNYRSGGSDNTAIQQLSSEETRQTFYKWQDESGGWHMADEAPEGVNAIPVSVDTAANIIQSVKVTKPSTTAPQSDRKEDEPAEVSSPVPGLPMTVNPADIPKLIDDAKNVKQMLEERNKNLENGG